MTNVSTSIGHPICILLVVKPTAQAGQYVTANKATGNPGDGLIIDSNNNWTQVDGGVNQNWGATIPLNSYTYLTVVYDGTDHIAYTNNVSTTKLYNLNPGHDDISGIAAGPAQTSPFTGYIAEAIYWTNQTWTATDRSNSQYYASQTYP